MSLFANKMVRVSDTVRELPGSRCVRCRRGASIGISVLTEFDQDGDNCTAYVRDCSRSYGEAKDMGSNGVVDELVMCYRSRGW
jgi:hypothetical protein